MTKIINIDEAIKISLSEKSKKQKVVLAGGCFDIIHIGHIKFLNSASKLGNVLMVLLENDHKVRNLKGQNHPYFKQNERAEVLSSVEFIDYVVLLPEIINDKDYEEIVVKIKPDVVAVTEKDPLYEKKKSQTEIVGGRIIEISHFDTLSSSKIAKLLGVD